MFEAMPEVGFGVKPRGSPSLNVQRQLVTALFNQRLVLVAGNVGLLAVAIFSWFETAQVWFLGWAVAIGLIAAARWAFECFYDLRAAEHGIAFWRSGYIAGAWATGVVVGCSANVILYHVDPLVQMLVLSTELVFVMGAAARVCAVPSVAVGQILLGLVPVFLVCVLASDPHYHYLSFAIAFELYGALALTRSLHAGTVRLLSLNEENAALVAEVQRKNNELLAANDRLETAAMTDSLTGIANRRGFDAAVATVVPKAIRESGDMALLLLDIDLFKGFNDLYGHQAGDDCLQRIAQQLAGSLGQADNFVARFGGEEFVAVLPRMDADRAAAAAEQVRADVAALEIVNAAAFGGIVTVSIGVAGFAPDGSLRLEDVIRAADEALYAAKALGRNRVCVAGVVGRRDLARRPAGVRVSRQAGGAVLSRPK